jgi:predicted ester cyclase
MKRLMLVFTVCAVVGCNKKKPEEAADPGSGSARVGSGSGSAAGSATGSAAGSGSTVAKPVKPWVRPKVFAGIDYEKGFAECWGFWNAGKLDAYKDCFTDTAVTDGPGSGEPDVKGNQAIADAIKTFKVGFPDARGEIEVSMISGGTAISIMLMTATSAGPAPTTGKKIGVEIAQVIDLDLTGHATHESDYFDQATMLGQLGVVQRPVREAITKPMLQEISVGIGDDREKANLATFGKLTAAFNKHDRKAVGELMADGIVWSEAAAPADTDKKGALDGLDGLWKAFGNLKFTPTKSWAAGDYVAATETFDGTNSGELTMMHVKATGKKVSLPFLAIYKVEDGKVSHAWVFYQSAGLQKQLGLAK